MALINKTSSYLSKEHSNISSPQNAEKNHKLTLSVKIIHHKNFQEKHQV